MSDDLATEVEKVKKRMTPRKDKPKPLVGLSTGSTLFNLACTGKPDIGLLVGNYYYFVGDSSSGKSFLTLTCLAEASQNPDFRDYRYIYDNAENGALMDIGRYFGKDVEKRLEPPAGNRKSPRYSATVEEFYYHVDDAFANGEPFVYILDSMDALSCDAEEDKFQVDKKARNKGKEEGGSYGTDKAKLNSSRIRIVFNRLRKENRSILILISQTRQNIGFGAQFNPKTRSGGKALTFYAALEAWSSVKGHIKTKVRGKDVEQGILCQIRTKKNRLSGKDRTVEFPILHSHGIDDLASCVNYLVEWKHWDARKDKQGNILQVTAPEFDNYTGMYETLIEMIQDQNQEGYLRELVAKVWHEVEAASQPKRKNRYE